jgi:hypothetical protein
VAATRAPLVRVVIAIKMVRKKSLLVAEAQTAMTATPV